MKKPGLNDVQVYSILCLEVFFVLNISLQWRSHEGRLWGQMSPTFCQDGAQDFFKTVEKISGGGAISKSLEE